MRLNQCSCATVDLVIKIHILLPMNAPKGRARSSELLRAHVDTRLAMQVSLVVGVGAKNDRYHSLSHTAASGVDVWWRRGEKSSDMYF